MQTYIWQRNNWPTLTWDTDKLLAPLGECRLLQGKLLSKVGGLGITLDHQAQAEILVEANSVEEANQYLQGTNEWTADESINAAVDEAVPVEVLSAALFARFRSRQEHTFAEKMLSAMRQKFGGHVEQKSG